MKIEDTDRFRNKFCHVRFKDGTRMSGRIFMIPNYSAKYDYHTAGWFIYVPGAKGDIQIKFKDIEEISVID